MKPNVGDEQPINRCVQQPAISVWLVRDGEMAPSAPSSTIPAYASVPCRRRPSGRAETLRRVREFMLTHLSDSDLTPLKAARANRISIRYLHLLFAGEATTAAGWIREQRIARCKLDLANAQLTNRSITQIALGWGFNDVGHFGKVFRRSVGMSPGSFRRQSLKLATT